jgi:FHA domain
MLAAGQHNPKPTAQSRPAGGDAAYTGQGEDLMRDDDSGVTAETVLVVRLSAPKAVAGLAPADEQQLRLDEELAFIQSLLAQSGECRTSLISGEELFALFRNGDAAFAMAGALQQTCSEPGRSPTLAHLRLLLDQAEPDEDHKPASFPADSERRSELIRQLPPHWVFATRAVTRRLKETFRIKFRPCDESTDDDVDAAGLYRAVFHEDATTRIAMPNLAVQPVAEKRQLSLRWRKHTVTLRHDSPSLTLGRSEQADVQIESELASRIHASVGFQNTNFILADQSTNGTFVQIEDTAEVCLHHEQIVLRGSGVISLGRQISHGRGKLIYFSMGS